MDQKLLLVHGGNVTKMLEGRVQYHRVLRGCVGTQTILRERLTVIFIWNVILCIISIFRQIKSMLHVNEYL